MSEPYIRQPAQIDISLHELTRYWLNGIEAFRVNMGLAAESGMSLDQFVEVAKTQVPLVRYIFDEASAFRTGRTGSPEIDGLARANVTRGIKNELHQRLHTLTSNYEAFLLAIKMGSRAWTYKMWEHSQQLMGFSPRLEAFVGWLATSELPSFYDAKVEMPTTLAGRTTFEKPAGYIGLRDGMEMFFSSVTPFQEGMFSFQFTNSALSCFFKPADGSKPNKARIEFESPLVEHRALNPRTLEAMGTAELLGGKITMTDLMNSAAVFKGLAPFAGTQIVEAERGRVLDVSQTETFRAIERANLTVAKVKDKLDATAWR